ncbi:MAG: translation elongation factor Ts [Patescibacteria group bacterium]|nr:translation elongation factor Ts [Patescibacteria group bacterium]
MAIKTEDIVKLRKQTGAGMLDCKKALEEAKGDFDKALEVLRKKGAKISAKRADREASEGFIATYSHGGRIGAMVELNSETDFVAKNSDFQDFAMELAKQVAAMAPEYIAREDVPKEVVEKELKLEIENAKKEGKPEDIAKKIAEGKIEKMYGEICLLGQAYIKDDKIKVGDLLNEKIASIGENIKVGRIARFEIGRSDSC